MINLRSIENKQPTLSILEFENAGFFDGNQLYDKRLVYFLLFVVSCNHHHDK